MTVASALLLSKSAIDLVSSWPNAASDALGTLIYIELAVALALGLRS